MNFNFHYTNGNHVDMYDDQEIYCSWIIDFLKGVDKGSK